MRIVVFLPGRERPWSPTTWPQGQVERPKGLRVRMPEQLFGPFQGVRIARPLGAQIVLGELELALRLLPDRRANQ